MIRDILDRYPHAQAIYDIGRRYAIVQGEDTLIVDKDTLEIDRALPTYSRELAEITNGGIPLWPADLDDDGD